VPDVCGALTVLCATTGNLLTHLAETGLVLPSGYFWLACRDAYHEHERAKALLRRLEGGRG